MIDFCSFNIRGLNKKCDFVKDFLNFNKISLIGLLETRVHPDVAKKLSSELNPRFSWVFNYSHHPGGRIWIGWNRDFWNVSVLSSSSQHITCSVSSLLSPANCVISFVYGLNTSVHRRLLWADLDTIADSIGDVPWALCGDFNSILNLEEAEGGNPQWCSGIREFNDCVLRLSLSDLRSIGSHLTWWDCNIHRPKFRKLDRVLVNSHWHNSFPLSLANFLPRGESDHCPAAVSFGLRHYQKPKPFQLFDFLLEHPDFISIVQEAWSHQFFGDPWYVVTSKLKLVKIGLKNLNKRHGNVHGAVDTSRTALFEFQAALPSLPSSDLLLEEKRLILNYSLALSQEESFLKQKSRVHWLKFGDGNNKFFHNSCKSRWNSNKILSILDDNGLEHTSHDSIAMVATSYFQDILGQTKQVIDIPDTITLPSLDDSQSQFLSRDFSEEEILFTLKKMAKGRSPGPDGLTVEFYLKAWHIIGTDVSQAILFFFDTLYLPRIINSAAIALVPKVQQPTMMSQFRPISCCNVLYKCIAKMLSRRLKKVLPGIISPVQSAFVPNRSIGDNIFLSQALCKDYHRLDVQPRCSIKLDIHKAFDSLNWCFIFEALRRMRFPLKFVNWIRTCITSCMYSVKVNGSLEGYFKGKSGLRQGDPLSPYLFVIAMEILSACLVKNVNDDPDFKFHWRTKELSIHHLIFADDIFLFSRGDLRSVNTLMTGVRLFENLSGLAPNCSKSVCFFSNVHDNVIASILEATGFQQGHLPIKYLGVPLITGRLKSRDCSPLVHKICSQIELWTCKFLNFGGRLQLLKTVLSGIIGYWSMFLFLPKYILKQVNALLFKFLWGGFYKASGKCHYKVGWLDCTKPMNEGGLGIRNLFEWNAAAVQFQLWRIIQPTSSSLWVNWFRTILLKRKAFWTSNIPFKCPWAASKILNSRMKARQWVDYKVGHNSSFFLWHDPWLRGKPILEQFSSHIVSHAQSENLATVISIQNNGTWSLPSSNFTELIDLRALIMAVQIQDTDSITWDGLQPKLVSISSIWRAIRSTSVNFQAFELVWRSFMIPKFSFILWLAVKNRLLTKDRMTIFGMAVDVRCVLCHNADESIHHLFTDCPYFNLVRNACPFALQPDWNICKNGDFLLVDIRGTKRKNAGLFFAAAVYHVWKERNYRMHNEGPGHPTMIVIRRVKQTLREKLFTCKEFQDAVAKENSLVLDLF